MKIDTKEDGLEYAYNYRLVLRENILDDNYESIGAGDWVVQNTHYDRQAIYERSQEYIENQYNLTYAVAVETYIADTWVVDINWLEQYMDNNRRNIIVSRTK